jgi:uncharacterized protein involved in exopolysaccharide biosynthesis
VRIAEQEAASDHLTFTRWIAGILLRWRIVVATTIGAIALGVLSILIVPPIYRASGSFVTNTSSTSKLQAPSGGSSAFGGLLSELGGNFGGDPSESPNFYVELLTTRELLTRLLQSKFPNPRTENPRDSATLLQILRIRQPDQRAQLEAAIKTLTKTVRPGLDPKTNFVWFSVDAQWPELSAQMANRLIALVTEFNRETRVSRAKARRTFLEMRHDSARAALHDAEERERLFYEQNRGLIVAPSLKSEEQQLHRDADLASDLYINLDRQLESARIDEINDAALITVIDSAVVPRKARWPRYGAIFITAILLGALVGLLFSGSLVVMEDWRLRNPQAAADFRSAIARMRGEVRTAVKRPAEREPPTVHPLGGASGLPPTDAESPDEPVVRTRRPVA